MAFEGADKPARVRRCGSPELFVKRDVRILYRKGAL
jgi:hypothetical protein